MALTYYVSSAGKYIATCLSSDTKPPAPADNLIVVETDTGHVFYSSGGTWNQASGGSSTATNYFPGGWT